MSESFEDAIIRKSNQRIAELEALAAELEAKFIAREFEVAALQAKIEELEAALPEPRP